MRSLALLILLLPGCTGLFYYPSREVYSLRPSNADDVAFRASDGVLLHGWVLHAEGGDPRATVVHFHGNAGNLTGHVRQLAWITRHGYDLFEFDYRGYGTSEGAPNPEGVNRDAVAAIEYANRELAPRSHMRLVAYGQSLGGAVMLRALGDTGTRNLIAVIVESSFNSYQEEAASLLYRTPILFPFFGLAYTLVSDRYAPAPCVAAISPVPLLIIHGDEDPIVDVRFGRVLYELARDPKELWIVPGGGHIDALTVDGGAYRQRLLAYLDRVSPLCRTCR